jgi:hypothetical protein
MSRIDYLRLRQAEAKRKAERAARLHRGQRAAGKALRDATHAILFAECRAAMAKRRKAGKPAFDPAPADLFSFEGSHP